LLGQAGLGDVLAATGRLPYHSFFRFDN
jgi:hypothetical protein